MVYRQWVSTYNYHIHGPFDEYAAPYIQEELVSLSANYKETLSQVLQSIEQNVELALHQNDKTALYRVLGLIYVYKGGLVNTSFRPTTKPKL